MKNIAAIILTLALAGCAGEQAGPTTASSAPEPAAAAAPLEQIVVKEPSPPAIGVSAARADAAADSKVVVEGRVKDFVDGAAVFTIVDRSIKACNDIAGDQCPTPWDYCCEPKENMVKGTATVALVGEDAQHLAGTVKGVKGVDHLTVVAAEGTARRDAEGNLTIEAVRLYVP